MRMMWAGLAGQGFPGEANVASRQRRRPLAGRGARTASPQPADPTSFRPDTRCHPAQAPSLAARQRRARWRPTCVPVSCGTRRWVGGWRVGPLCCCRPCQLAPPPPPPLPLPPAHMFLCTQPVHCLAPVRDPPHAGALRGGRLLWLLSASLFVFKPRPAHSPCVCVFIPCFPPPPPQVRSVVADYYGYFTASSSLGGITSGSQWLVWRFESDSTLGDACDGQLGPFPVGGLAGVAARWCRRARAGSCCSFCQAGQPRAGRSCLPRPACSGWTHALLPLPLPAALPGGWVSSCRYPLPRPACLITRYHCCCPCLPLPAGLPGGHHAWAAGGGHGR